MGGDEAHQLAWANVLQVCLPGNFKSVTTLGFPWALLAQRSTRFVGTEETRDIKTQMQMHG
jgi:hypothetical protein